MMDTFGATPVASCGFVFKMDCFVGGFATQRSIEPHSRECVQQQQKSKVFFASAPAWPKTEYIFYIREYDL